MIRSHLKLPGIEKLTDSGFCKVVQLGADGLDYILFGNECDYHASILGFFLSSSDLSFNYGPGLEIDLSSGDGRWNVYGMGKLIIRPDSGMIYFTGDSTDYGTGIDRDHVERMKSVLESAGYTDVSCSSR